MNKSKTPVRLAKPAAGAPVLTDQQKAEQVARFFTQKRESYFELILANLIQAGTHPKDAVDLAIEGADYAIEKLFPLPTAEKKEDE
jgi:hypothetical protein